MGKEEIVIPLYSKLSYYPQEELDSINEELIETSNISITQHINNPNTYFLGTDSITNHFYLSTPQKEKILSELENNEFTNTLFLNEYQNNKLLNTIWSGACGPTVMSWLYY